jgi:predicted TIM-barrel fold metal-dependent hydrolase
MMTIDSDAHVIECEQTWTYVDAASRDLMPRLLTEPDGDGTGHPYWLFEGRAHHQSNVGASTPKESRELADVDARLRHMDELEIDIQVLFPSLFLRPLAHGRDTEVALAQSYNRWLADIWSHGKGRLRWAAIMPTMDMDATVRELRWAREHGACAAFTCGIVRDMSLDNPYFYPVYETLSELDMPLCIHAGNQSFLWEDLFATEGGYSRAKLAVVSAFHSLAFHGVPSRFPKLRIGFIEAASQWVPGTVHDIARRMEKRTGKPFDRYNFLRENRLYVTCQTDDDLPYVLKYAGDSNLVVGTDYGHNDTATEIEALRYFKTQGEETAAAIGKILDDNARALYSL